MPVKSKLDPPVPPTCPRCQNPRRSNERFCYNCGLELREDAGAIEAYLSNILPARVDTILKTRLSEQKLVEVETAELLAERAMKWMKTIGYFVGFPLLAASIVLSFFGYKTYSDFEKASEKAAQFAKRIDEEAVKFEPAQQKIAALDKSVQEATQKVKEQIAQIDASQKQLQGQVKSLEDRLLTFVPSKDLSPELEETLQRQLIAFNRYLESLGFSGLDSGVNVCIFSEQDSKSCGLRPGQPAVLNAYYDGKTMNVHAKLVAMPSIVLNVYTLYALSQRKNASNRFIDLDAALADYFPASYLNNPIIGEGYGMLSGLASSDGISYLRTLDNALKYSEQRRDIFNNGNVWGGAMWRCRLELGSAVVDRLAVKAWQQLASDSVGPKDFGRALIDLEAKAVTGKASCFSQEIVQRGLPH